MRRTVSALCVDLETTGLSIDEDLILEIGMVALDDNLDVIDTYQAIVSGPTERFRLHELAAAANRGDDDAAFIIEMHTSNGLLGAVEAARGVSIEEAQAGAIAWMDQIGASGLPMMGSSVHFDRKFLENFMPDLEGKFHYRNIDVSSIKGWLNLVGDPAILQEVSILQQDLGGPKGLHRSVSDCMDTRDELRRYTEVLLS